MKTVADGPPAGAAAGTLAAASRPKQEEEVHIGWMTEAKDWAGELISGQTKTGQVGYLRIIAFEFD